MSEERKIMAVWLVDKTYTSDGCDYFTTHERIHGVEPVLLTIEEFNYFTFAMNTKRDEAYIVMNLELNKEAIVASYVQEGKKIAQKKEEDRRKREERDKKAAKNVIDSKRRRELKKLEELKKKYEAK